MERTMFRVYGQFAWPPLPESPSTDELAQGMVEFGFIDLPTFPKPQPFVRWVPRDSTLAPLSKDTRNLAHFDDTDRKALRQSDPKTSFAFLLGEAIQISPTPAVAHLRFRGAVVFEQWRAKGAASSEPMMRWLLARSFARAGSVELSEVLVGLNGDKTKIRGSSFAFAFALPTPVTQSRQNGTSCRAFPFIARYRPAVTALTPDQALDAHSIAPGTLKEAMSPVALDSIDLVSNTLGGFGFCRTDGKRDAVFLPRLPSTPIDERDERDRRRMRERFWPSDPAIIAREILLKLLGADTGVANAITPFATRLMKDSLGYEFDAEQFDAGEVSNSIHFSGNTDGSGTAIRFRYAIHAHERYTAGPLQIMGSSSRRQFFVGLPGFEKNPLRSNSDILIFEFELAYSIPVEQIWDAVEGTEAATGKAFPAVSLTAMCGLKGTLSTDIGSGTVQPQSHGVATLLDTSTRAARRAREALLRVDGSHPESILPDIGFAGGADFRLAYCLKLDAHFGRADDTPLSWELPARKVDALAGRLSLWPKPKALSGNPRDAAPLAENELYELPVSLVFPGFEIGATTPISASLVHDTAAVGRMDHEPFPISLRILPTPASRPLRARLGGLAIRLDGTVLRGDSIATLPGEADDDYSVWRFDGIDPVASGTAGDSKHTLRLRFTASAIEPLAPDMPRGDRSGRSRPLLLSLGPAIPSPPSSADALPVAPAAIDPVVPIPYLIDMRETIGARTDRLLTADVIDLRDEAATDGPNSYVILSEQPFSISRFEAQPLRYRGSADRAFVASYSSDTAGWSFKQAAEHYHYTFPAQAVGETMDKPRRLEIHDPAPDDPQAALLPYAADGTSTDGRPPVARRHLVEYRLTPSAEIWIRPSDVHQGFFRPEWATHALFREAGGLGVGAALQAFRGEFLYGMPVGVDVSLERGAAGGARVAEVEALVGRPLGPISAAAADADLAARWDRISTMFARRPERLEFWMRAPGPVSAFTPARFADGVNFVLRDSAVHKPPLESPLIVPERSAGPRIRPHGLAGGALWPLESALFTQRLLEAPRSSAGTIEKVALSPLGGDADQRAEFLAGQVAIISETRGGRVQRHRVEIIGRISVFWHRAKHVVIYERTASPTQQFGPEGGMGTRSRRPILRKVSEFIELIEPTRRYPDDPAADAMTAGFLNAVRFNSRVIAVDSAWSEDIPEAGWRIPLWNRHAARQRPSVYPRPDIVTLTAAEGPGEQPTIAQEILDPDNLFFFADAMAGHADTDRWVARCGIDYANMPAPNHGQQQPAPSTGTKKTGGRLPSAMRIPRGQRCFTWRLGPAARKTAINARRAEEPIFAALETISFQRATQHQTQRSKDVEALMGKAGEFFGPQDLAAKVEMFAAAVAADDDTALLASAKDLVKALTEAINHRHDAELAPFTKLAGSPPKTCDKMLDQLTGGIERQKLLILDAVRNWQSDAAELLLRTHPESRAATIDAALVALKELVAPLLSDAAENMGRIGDGAERARHIVQDIKADFRESITTAQQRIGALKTSYDRAKPWSPARINDIHDRLREIRDGLIGDIDVSASEFRSRLATEVDGIARKLGVDVGCEVNALLTSLEELKSLAKREAGGFHAWLGVFHDQTVRLTDGSGPIAGARTAIAKLPPAHDAHKAKALQLLDGVERLAEDAGKAIARLQDRIEVGDVAIENALNLVESTVTVKGAEAAALLAELKTLIATLGEDEVQSVKHEILALGGDAAQIVDHIASLGGSIDGLVDETADVTARLLVALSDRIGPIFMLIDTMQMSVSGTLDAIRDQLGPEGQHSLYGPLEQDVLKPALEDSFAILDEAGRPRLDELQMALDTLADAIERRIIGFTASTQGKLEALRQEVGTICGGLQSGLEGARKQLESWGDALTAEANDALGKIGGVINDAQKLRDLSDTILSDARDARATLEKSWVGASAYADTVFQAAGNIGSGDISAAPGQILRLYAAAASAPALPNLDFARERLGYYYNELNKIIDTTPAEAWFGRLGDELKAMGLALPFKKLGDRILPDDLSQFDIGKVFRNFGGIDLRQLFKGVKLPASAKDAIKLTHAFDKKQARAWVQVDIDAPLPGRRPLIGIGPFKLDFVDARLVGTLRLEASKDSEQVEQTGRARLLTDIDAVVSGQSMVRLEKLAIHYERSSGLKVDFDPRNVKINPALKFIQDALGQLLPDALGDLKVVKEKGIPVGVSHDFAMPPVSLMVGTSGVSNIAISNSFALVAYPDFVISDRFCLSRPDLPFLFSIFIIGGTGYVMVDVDYRPFSKALMVTVEAAAGGSAALGFAAGPVSGSVFVTLSIALSYRKLIGAPGGGLTIACVLLIAGNVDVAGIATVYMGLMLRMSYRENGQIDGVGTLKITIRISRFFKITVRRDVTYKLRGGGGGGGVHILADLGESAQERAARQAAKILAARS